MAKFIYNLLRCLIIVNFPGHHLWHPISHHCSACCCRNRSLPPQGEGVIESRPQGPEILEGSLPHSPHLFCSTNLSSSLGPSTHPSIQLPQISVIPHPSFQQFSYTPIHLYVCPSTHLPTYPSRYPSIHLPINTTAQNPPVHLSTLSKIQPHIHPSHTFTHNFTVHPIIHASAISHQSTHLSPPVLCTYTSTQLIKIL